MKKHMINKARNNQNKFSKGKGSNFTKNKRSNNKGHDQDDQI